MTAGFQPCIQPVPVPITLPVNGGNPFHGDKRCFTRDLFFFPIRFCGRQWVWINSDSDNRISQVALKILAVPFLACATLVSRGIAIVGTLIFSADAIPSYIKYSPEGDITLLRRNRSDEEVAQKIKEQLNESGYVCSIQVRSLDRAIVHADYYPENIHRYITLTNPSSTPSSRREQVIKNHFLNKKVSSLDSLYPCIYGRGTSENLKQLKDVLDLHKSVTFSLAFDLAYVRIELGSYTFH